MKQRLLIILLTLLTTMTAGAYDTSGTFDSGKVQWNLDIGTKTLTFTGSGNIPDNNYGSFLWDNTLVEHLVFDSGITRIGKNVFKNHGYLKDVVFQAGSQLTEIGYQTFAGCTSLSSIKLPNSLQTIEGSAFQSCSSLMAITIPASVKTIVGNAFDNCTGLITCTILSIQLTRIDDGCFQSCSKLTAIDIPDGVTSIGPRAFSGCRSLEYVTLPGSLENIESQAFYNCSSLVAVFCKVADPTKLTIDNEAFNNNTAFYLSPDADIEAWTSVQFTNITYNTFSPITVESGETNVTLDFSGTLTVTKRTGNGAMGDGFSSSFDDYKFYINKVIIEPGVTTIGNSAFLVCTGLTSVTISGSVKTIGNSAFMGCIGLTSVTIGDGVTTIGNYAFWGCTGLTSVTIPSSVTTIGDDAFLSCTGLTSVTIPSSVTTIGEYAFRDCTGLPSVTIPSSVKSIGDGAFLSCTGLTSVTIFAPSLMKYEDLAFASNAEGRKIYVPSGSVNTYKAGWSDFASAIEPLHYIIDEGNDVSNLNMSNGTGKNVALKRSFAKGKKQTVCLPYAPAELLNYGKVWEFTGINGDKAVMTEITNKASLQANTPYIFEATNDLLNITFPGVEISIGSDPKTAPSGAGFTFHGTYAEKIWEATSDEVTGGTIYGFMMKDNDGQTVGQFVKARRRTVLRPFSCYLEYSGSLTGTASATRGEAQEPLPEVIDIVWLAAGDTGTATGIKEVKSEKYGVEGWFSLDGRRLSGKPSQKGLYIHNGTKVVIK